MKDETLRKICTHCSPLSKVATMPFIVNGYKYFFNRYFGVRISTNEPDNITINNLILLIIDKFSDKQIIPGMAQVITKKDSTEFMKNVPVCPHCDPNIKEPALRTCYECDGEGTIELENDYNDYECDCKSCDGNGYRRVRKGLYMRSECPACGGNGINDNKTPIVAIGKKFINAKFIEFLTDMFGEITIKDQCNSHSMVFSAKGNIEGVIGSLYVDARDLANNEIEGHICKIVKKF